mgnify:FL=1
MKSIEEKALIHLLCNMYWTGREWNYSQLKAKVDAGIDQYKQKQRDAALLKDKRKYTLGEDKAILKSKSIRKTAEILGRTPASVYGRRRKLRGLGR